MKSIGKKQTTLQQISLPISQASVVILASNKAEPGIKCKLNKFGIKRRVILCRITYPKSSLQFLEQFFLQQKKFHAIILIKYITRGQKVTIFDLCPNYFSFEQIEQLF
ncbi:hypothetical protein GQR58_011537 [Nymphon striatum]|nr:hypothetical protein GQR58_011537 [Nymphon striatum]